MKDCSYADWTTMTTMIDHAVNVMKAETIVGHVPREMSRTFWHFIGHGRSFGYEVMGRKLFGKGLKIAGGGG